MKEAPVKGKFVFLSDAFYEHCAEHAYREIEQKQTRPYLVLLVEIEGKTWGLPFRSGIKHQHAFWTNRNEHCGIDYSKAVVIESECFIDASRTPHLRQNEFEALRGQEFNIYKGFLAYIDKYKKAKRSGHPRYHHLVAFSTLQNYESIIDV